MPEPTDFTPDYTDPAMLDSEPEKTILHFLRTLTERYQRVSPELNAEERALGVLVIARGIDIDEEPQPWHAAQDAGKRRPLVRLTVSGLRWQGVLKQSEAIDAVKARTLVLRFVWEAYLSHRVEYDAQASATSVSVSLAAAKAETGPIVIHNHVAPPAVTVQVSAPPTETKPVDQTGGQRKPGTPRENEVDWHSIQKRLQEIHASGREYTSCRAMAEELDCAPSTITKALRRDVKLLHWSAPKQKQPHVRSLSPVDIDNARGREADPADAAEAAEEAEAEEHEAVYRQLLENSTPEERARINSMPEDQLRELLKTLKHDPDKHRRMRGRKP